MDPVSPHLARWAKSKENLDLTIKAAETLVSCCVSLGLECRDPPLVSSGLLRSLGASQYRLRTFWNHIPEGVHHVVLYRVRSSIFTLEAERLRGPVYEVLCRNGLLVPVDERDRRRIPWEDLVFTSNSNLLFVRLHGEVYGNTFKANIARVLAWLERANPGITGRAASLLEDLVWGRSDPEVLVDGVLRLIGRWGNVLEFFLPVVPYSRGELLSVSPLLRFLVGGRM